MTDLFRSRDLAEKSLEGELSDHADILERMFSLLDSCIDRLESVDSQFSRVCGLTAIKGKSLAIGMYSLALDGLAQESGALLRPFIEVVELLVYFRLDPQRVDEAIGGTLPTAGIIAKEIKGDYKDLREYLNEHAAHFGFTHESLRHAMDFTDLKWKKSQSHEPSILRRNLGTLFAFLSQLTLEAFNCSSTAQGLVDHQLGSDIDKVRDSGIDLFFPDLT